MSTQHVFERFSMEAELAAEDLVRAALEDRERWWRFSELKNRIEYKYSGAALGFALDQLLVNGVFKLHKDMFKDRLVQLTQDY